MWNVLHSGGISCLGELIDLGLTESRVYLHGVGFQWRERKVELSMEFIHNFRISQFRAEAREQQGIVAKQQEPAGYQQVAGRVKVGFVSRPQRLHPCAFKGETF